MRSLPLVSIVFPNYNGGSEPLECLKSIKNLSYPKDKIEVIVIDNNSTDGSLQNIKYTDQKIKIIENKENVGFAKAINQGIKQSNGEYIFIGNDDIVFDKDSLKILVEYLINHPKVAIAGGKIFSKNNPTEVVSCGYMMNKWTGNIYPSPNPNVIKEPDWIQGCAMLVRKSVFDQIGIFDDNFSFIYFEDFDFCLRAKKAGYKISYLPTAYFWHGQSKTMDKDLQRKYYQWYKNKLRFTIKNLPIFNILSVLLIQFVLITPFRALALRDRRFIPFLKGLFWNIIHLLQTLEVRRNMA